MDANFLNNIFNLKDKVVLVTGACGQLGRVICHYFVESGSIVIGVDLKITSPENDIEYIETNILNAEILIVEFQKIIEKYGKIDVLINNAGVSTFEPFEKRPEEKFDWVMDVNLKGTFNCIQKYVELYDKYALKKGNIINTGSIYGIISPDFRIYTDCDRKNSEIYGATKAGIIQMTKYFAVHLAERNIRVNCVSPGGIFNPENPQGEEFRKHYAYRCPMNRMAKDFEIVGAMLYLASESASYTTGQNLTIDGGMSCW